MAATAYEDRPGYVQTKDVLFRIKRGLVSYVSYLAACEMNQAFSEYVLYEPILRILMACGFQVACEVECPGIEQAPIGDRKRLGFVAHNDEIEFALEVKWIKKPKMSVARDIEKLQAYIRERPDSLGLICLFGKQSVHQQVQAASWPVLAPSEPHRCRAHQHEIRVPDLPAAR